MTTKWYHKWAWYERDTPVEEKRLLFKLDITILTFGCLTFFTKFLDLQAYQNAYVTGMKEDVGMQGNDLQYTTGVFQAGYCSMMIPANILLTRVAPNIFIPACEILWGILTLCTAFVDNVSHVYLIRFFSGVFECVAYPGVIYCIGCWYKRSEVSRRLSLFYIAGPLGTMFAGYFQSACYTNLNGKGGLAGWRWLFIICAIITIPVAVFGAFIFPARPDSPRPSLILTSDEIALARRRLEMDGNEAPKIRLNGQIFLQILSSWRPYAFVLLYIVFNQAMITNGQPFSLYLKAHSDIYTESEINTYPTGQSAVSIVTALIFCYWADVSGKRWLPSLVICVWMIFGSICMAVWDIPVGLKFFAFYVAGMGGALNPLFMSWASEVTVASAEERAVTISSMNAFGQALLAGLNIVTFPTPKAPRFEFGWYWVMANNIAQAVIVVLIVVLYARQKRREVPVIDGEVVERPDGVVVGKGDKFAEDS